MSNIHPSSIILRSKVESDVNIGPFCFVRDSVIKSGARIGSNVEIARSSIGENTSISHQAVVLDSEIGNDVIVGAGVVFANYNPVKREKYLCKVGEGAVIGCNSVVVAPSNVPARMIIPALTKYRSPSED